MKAGLNSTFIRLPVALDGSQPVGISILKEILTILQLLNQHRVIMDKPHRSDIKENTV